MHALFVPASRVALSGIGAALVLGPLAAILIFAFTWDSSTPLFQDARFRSAIGNTIVVTGAATITTLIFSVPMAWAVTRGRLRHVWLWDNLSMLPAVVPPLVGAVGWLVLLSPRVGLFNVWLREAGFEPLEIIFTPVGIGIVVGFYQVPFMFVHLRGALQQVSASYEQAARIFGTSGIAAFVTIALSLVRASFLSAVLAVIMRSLANIGVPLILGQTARIYVLSNLLFSYVFSEGDMGRAAQLGLIFMAVAALLYYLQSVVLRNRITSTINVRAARGAEGVVTRASRIAAYAILVAYALPALILPLVGVLYLSLTAFWNPYILEAVFTLKNYFQIFANDVAQSSVRTTLIASGSGAALAVLLATLLCFNATRENSRWDRINNRLFAVPLGVPPLVFGIGVLFTVLRLPLPVYGTVAATIWALVAYWVAFAQQAIEPFFRQIPRAYDEAAAIVGDSALERFGNILLPLLGSNLVLVGGLLLLNMMTDLPLVIFLTSPGSNIMPAQLYAFWSQASPVLAAAFAIEMIVVALLAAGAILAFRDWWIGRRVVRETSAHA